MQIEEFYSHGKLLLTGEYVVLDGAEALALPCNLGQSLSVKKRIGGKYSWTSYLKDGEVWQKLNFSLEDIHNYTLHTGFEKRLFQILQVVCELNPEVFKDVYDFSTKLDFDKNWGLGSSSTLINNIAKWANIDPYKLLDKTFGGSGYDIAAASMASPFIYKRSERKVFTNKVELSDTLQRHMFFVFLNQKQNSRTAIENYRIINKKERVETIKNINAITQEIEKVKDLKVFDDLLRSHENLISDLIGAEPVQKQKFKDFNSGVVKSLGAWGGDFVLVTANEKSELDYFTKKGFTTIFEYKNLIL